MHRRSLTALVFIVGSGLLATAWAPGGAAAADEATERAKSHNARARGLFILGRYEEAAQEYSKAYEARPVPEFLHNMGQCHTRLAARANLEKALFYFESYLESAPNAPNREEVETEIAELKAQIAKLKGRGVMPGEASPDEPATSRPALPSPPQAPKPAPEVAAPSPTSSPAFALTEHNRAPSPVPAAVQAHRPFYKTWWFWTAVGVAVAGATTATIVAAQPGDPSVSGSLATFQF